MVKNAWKHSPAAGRQDRRTRSDRLSGRLQVPFWLVAVFTGLLLGSWIIPAVLLLRQGDAGRAAAGSVLSGRAARLAPLPPPTPSPLPTSAPGKTGP